MKELLKKAGLTPEILKDPATRAGVIDEFNAKAGGLRALMRAGKLEPASCHEIPAKVSDPDAVRYLRFVASGKRVPIIFAAGRATRLDLPREYDRFGIAGLTPKMLARIGNIPQTDLADLSFIQRQILQYRYQIEQLVRRHDVVTLESWLENASFAVVANEENKFELALQLAAVRFAGLKPEHVYLIAQPEEGGLEVFSDGTTKPFNKETWPEGHGKPFLDMQADPQAAYRLNARGHLVPLKRTLVSELLEKGVERAVFAQVNDLHLLEDMAQVERWAAADGLIEKGAEMVMEMVENALKQKGGGIFTGKDGHAVMRDTIAMRSKDLEGYSVPETLSRMFYELTVKGLSKLGPDVLPAYLTERKTSGGKSVLTREFYSGDASSALGAEAMRQGGCALDTFKTRERIARALEALRDQDSQPGFSSIISLLK